MCPSSVFLSRPPHCFVSFFLFLFVFLCQEMRAVGEQSRSGQRGLLAVEERRTPAARRPASVTQTNCCSFFFFPVSLFASFLRLSAEGHCPFFFLQILLWFLLFSCCPRKRRKRRRERFGKRKVRGAPSNTMEKRQKEKHHRVFSSAVFSSRVYADKPAKEERRRKKEREEEEKKQKKQSRPVFFLDLPHVQTFSYLTCLSLSLRLLFFPFFRDLEKISSAVLSQFWVSVFARPARSSGETTGRWGERSTRAFRRCVGMRARRRKKFVGFGRS